MNPAIALENPVTYDPENFQFTEFKKYFPESILRGAELIKKLIANHLHYYYRKKGISAREKKRAGDIVFCAVMKEKYGNEISETDLQMLLCFESLDVIREYLKKHKRFLENSNLCKILYRDIFKRICLLFDEVAEKEGLEKFVLKTKSAIRLVVPNEILNITLPGSILNGLAALTLEEEPLKLHPITIDDIPLKVQKDLILKSILEAVPDLTLEMILSKSRDIEIPRFRYCALGLAEELGLIKNEDQPRSKKMSYEEAGEWLGGKDHATMMHGLKTFHNLLEAKDREFTDLVNLVRKKLLKNLKLHTLYFQNIGITKIKSVLEKNGVKPELTQKLLAKIQKDVLERFKIQRIEFIKLCVEEGIAELNFS